MISIGVRPQPGRVSTLRAPAGLEQAWEAAATAAVIELLAAYRVPITTVTGPALETHLSALAALGVVRFTAPGLSGTAVLGAAASTLRRSNAHGTSDRDWAAELANQFIGRFKLKLLRGGFELWSMAPVAVTGRLIVSAVSRPEFMPIAFLDSEGGVIAVWIEIELHGPLKMAGLPADGDVPHEGDVILF